MPQHRICITLEGPDTEQGHVRATDFVNTLERIASMLRRLDRKISSNGKESFYLRVVDLSHASPTRVVLEQCLLSANVDRRQEVAKRLIAVMEAIEDEEKEVGQMDYEILSQAEELTAPVGKALKTLCISTDDVQYEVGLDFRERLAKRLAPEQASFGSIRGMLEYINIHGEKPVFRIYPDVGPEKITCTFGQAMLAEARAGVGQFVEVRGYLKYKVVAKYPHEIEAREVVVLSGAGAEALIEARGMFPDLTGDMTTEEYLTVVRGADES